MEKSDGIMHKWEERYSGKDQEVDGHTLAELEFSRRTVMLSQLATRSIPPASACCQFTD
jgi:hypothetical protein